MPGQYDLQPNFPIAGVADLIAQRPFKENQMRQQQAQDLIQGLGLFQNGVQSLVNRRNQMAQALAQSKIFAATPEGQQLMAPTVSPTPGYGAPIPAGAQGPAGPTTTTPSSIDENTLATAFKGGTPENFLSNIQTQMANKKAYDLEAMKEANTQSIAKQHNALLQNIFQGGLGVKKGALAEKESTDIESQIADLNKRKVEASKNLQTGFWNGINNEKAVQAKHDIVDFDNQIAQLQAKKSGGDHPALDGMTPAQKLALYNSL